MGPPVIIFCTWTLSVVRRENRLLPMGWLRTGAVATARIRLEPVISGMTVELVIHSFLQFVALAYRIFTDLQLLIELSTQFGK
jgi:hypothetical protein